jgi:chromosome segregation ATPase
MDLESLVEEFKDMILGEIKEEFKDFKASVTGELSGFRLAIEAMNGRMSGIEARMNGIETKMNGIEARMNGIELRINALEERQGGFEKRLDDLRIELKAEIAQNTMRIDETNKRIDVLYREVMELTKRVNSLHGEVMEMRVEVREALSTKEVVKDLLLRIERLETRVGA